MLSFYTSQQWICHGHWVWISECVCVRAGMCRDSTRTCWKHFGFCVELAPCVNMGKQAMWTKNQGTRLKEYKRITENPSHVLSTILELSRGCQKRNSISWIICSQMNWKQKTTQKYADEFIWQHIPIAKILFATIFQHFNPINLPLSFYLTNKLWRLRDELWEKWALLTQLISGVAKDRKETV